MRRLLILLVLSGVAWAAPPVVTVPAEVTGDVGDFVAVKAAVKDGKAVKFVQIDAGLKVFPPGMLLDPTATVVTSATTRLDGPAVLGTIAAYITAGAGDPLSPKS